MKNRIKKLVTVLLSLILLVSLSQTALATTNSVTILSPYSGGYFLKDPSVSQTITADVTGTPTTIKFNYIGGTDASPLFGDSGYLKSSGYSRYSCSWTPSLWIKPIHTTGQWIMPNIRVMANFSNGPVLTRNIPGYITANPKSEYIEIDPNFNYYSYYINNFRGVATGLNRGVNMQQDTYNCVAYVLGIDNYWIEPWSSFPSVSQIEDFMNNRRYNTVNINERPEIIYYDGGHFARVTQWNSNNYPIEIFSKWGALELVKSDSYNPFTSNSYGNPVLFFKSIYSNSVMSNSITWNDETKSYYDSSFVEYDSSSKTYKDKKHKTVTNNIESLIDTNSYESINIAEEKNTWFKKNEFSNNDLYKALVKYIKTYRENEKPYESFYFRDKDKALHILTDLGDEYIPEMLYEISLGNPWSFNLMVAVEEITQVEKTQQINAMSNKSRNKWIDDFKVKYNLKKAK